MREPSILRRAARALAVPARVAPVPWLGDTRSSGLAAPESWLYDALAGRPAASGERVTPENVLAIDAVWASVGLIAGQAGSLPLVTYRGRGQERVRALDDPRYGMLHDGPNPVTQADAFVETVLASLLLWGNGFAQKVKGGGRVRELWFIQPRGVEVELTSSGVKRFHIPGDSRSYGTDAVLHIPGLSFDGVRGKSVIEVCRDSLGTLRARDLYEARLYANDATPGGILSVDGELSEEGARRLRQQWEDMHRGGEQRHRVAVLEGGTSWQSLQMPLKDYEFVARSKFSVAQVARLFGLQPELIGGESGGSMTYSNVESRMIEFVVLTLRRWLVRIERALKHDPDLFPEPDVYAEFLLAALMRGDHAARAAFYATMRGIGAMSVNEIREEENLPGIGPAGDVYATNIPGAAPQGEQPPPAAMETPALDEAVRRLQRLGFGHALAGANGNGTGGAQA